MNSKYIACKTAGEGWLRCMSATLAEGSWTRDEDVQLLELRNVYIDMEGVSAQDPAFVELADRARIELMDMKYKSMSPVAHYKISYGALLRDNRGIDQLEWAIQKLKQKKESKSATIGFHTPGEEQLSCISIIDFKLRNDSLHMNSVYRSQNVYASQPGNMLALRSIQEEAAAKLGVLAGTFSLIVLSAHVYEHDLDKALDVVHRARAQGLLVDPEPNAPIKAKQAIAQA